MRNNCMDTLRSLTCGVIFVACGRRGELLCVLTGAWGRLETILTRVLNDRRSLFRPANSTRQVFESGRDHRYVTSGSPLSGSHALAPAPGCCATSKYIT